MQSHFTPEQLADPTTAASEGEIRKCVHCGFCLATCPTYALLGDERDSPRGRIYLVKDMLERQAQPSEAVVRHLDRCLSCLACESTCPSGVSYRRLIDQGRAYVEERYERPAEERHLRRLLTFVLPHRRRFAVALFLGRTFGWLKPLLPRVLRTMVDQAQRQPEPFASSLGARPQVRAGAQRVVLMAGCVEPGLAPHIQAAAERLLTRAGLQVVRTRGEGCCGALSHHLGREDEFRALARRTIDAWCAALDAGAVAITGTTSGCTSVIRDYAQLLRTDDGYSERAARVAGAFREISDLLAGADLPTLPANGMIVAHQAACSLRHGLRGAEAPKALLRRAGFTVVEPAESHLCCGSAGTYSLTQPQISEALRARKAAALAATDADVVASDNIGCIAHLHGAEALRVAHTLELVDWAYAQRS